MQETPTAPGGGAGEDPSGRCGPNGLDLRSSLGEKGFPNDGFGRNSPCAPCRPYPVAGLRSFGAMQKLKAELLRLPIRLC